MTSKKKMMNLNLIKLDKKKLDKKKNNKFKKIIKNNYY